MSDENVGPLYLRVMS